MLARQPETDLEVERFVLEIGIGDDDQRLANSLRHARRHRARHVAQHRHRLLHSGKGLAHGEEGLRLRRLHDDVVVGERALLLDLPEPRLDVPQPRGLLAQRPLGLRLLQHEHAADLVRRDPGVEHAPDLIEGEPEPLQGEDAIELGQLIRGVIAVARLQDRCAAG